MPKMSKTYQQEFERLMSKYADAAKALEESTKEAGAALTKAQAEYNITATPYLEALDVVEKELKHLSTDLHLGHTFAGFTVAPIAGYTRTSYSAKVLDEAVRVLEYINPGMADLLKGARKATGVAPRATIKPE